MARPLAWAPIRMRSEGRPHNEGPVACAEKRTRISLAPIPVGNHADSSPCSEALAWQCGDAQRVTSRSEVPQSELVEGCRQPRRFPCIGEEGEYPLEIVEVLCVQREGLAVGKRVQRGAIGQKANAVRGVRSGPDGCCLRPVEEQARRLAADELAHAEKPIAGELKAVAIGERDLVDTNGDAVGV